MSGIDVMTSVDLSPSQVAELFWGLDSKQQADFFAALDSIAGLKLCFQMAAVVSEITDRAGKGQHDALNGFRTMLAHAQDYAEGAAELRASDAKWALRGAVAKAKGEQP